MQIDSKIIKSMYMLSLTFLSLTRKWNSYVFWLLRTFENPYCVRIKSNFMFTWWFSLFENGCKWTLWLTINHANKHKNHKKHVHVIFYRNDSLFPLNWTIDFSIFDPQMKRLCILAAKNVQKSMQIELCDWL